MQEYSIKGQLFLFSDQILVFRMQIIFHSGNFIILQSLKYFRQIGLPKKVNSLRGPIGIYYLIFGILLFGV